MNTPRSSHYWPRMRTHTAIARISVYWIWTTGVVSFPLISHLHTDISRSYQFPVESTAISPHLRHHFRQGKQNAGPGVASTGKTTMRESSATFAIKQQQRCANNFYHLKPTGTCGEINHRMARWRCDLITRLGRRSIVTAKDRGNGNFKSRSDFAKRDARARERSRGQSHFFAYLFII